MAFWLLRLTCTSRCIIEKTKIKYLNEMESNILAIFLFRLISIPPQHNLCLQELKDGYCFWRSYKHSQIASSGKQFYQHFCTRLTSPFAHPSFQNCQKFLGNVPFAPTKQFQSISYSSNLFQNFIKTKVFCFRF